VFVWRTTIEDVGHFDATLQSRGDAQWGQRVAAAGGLQRFAPEAIVDHPARANLRELLTKQLRVARGHRDVALTDGRRIRHFGGIAANQLTTALKTPFTVWSERSAATTPVKTLRYTAVLLVIRAAWVTTFLGGALRVLRRDVLSRREPAEVSSGQHQGPVPAKTK
jgi:hypothetical protein